MKIRLKLWQWQCSVFSVKIAALTSSVVLMSWNIKDQIPNPKVIVCRKFHFDCLKRFSTKAILELYSFTHWLLFDPYLNVIVFLLLFFLSNDADMHIFFISGSGSIKNILLFLKPRQFRFQRFSNLLWLEVDDVER